MTKWKRRTKKDLDDFASFFSFFLSIPLFIFTPTRKTKRKRVIKPKVEKKKYINIKKEKFEILSKTEPEPNFILIKVQNPKISIEYYILGDFVQIHPHLTFQDGKGMFFSFSNIEHIKLKSSDFLNEKKLNEISQKVLELSIQKFEQYTKRKYNYRHY